MGELATHIAGISHIESMENAATEQRPRFLAQSIILAILAFSSTFATAVVFPNIGSFVRDRFILTDTLASLFAVFYLVPHIFFAFIWGALSDRYGKRTELLIGGYIATAVFHFFLPYTESFTVLLLLRFCEGASSILGFSMVMTKAIDLARRTNYGMVMGLMGGAVSLGTTFAFPVGGALGVRSMFLLCTVGSIVLLSCAFAAWLLLKKDHVREKARSFRDALLVLKRDSRLRIPYIFTFVDRFTVGFFAVTFPLFVATTYGIDARQSGMLLAGFLLPFSILTAAVGRAVDAIGGSILLVTGSICYGIAVLFVGYVSPDQLIVVMIICGIFAAIMYAPSLWMLARFSPPEMRASAVGGFNAVGSIGFAIGPVAGALISDSIGYKEAFLFAGFTEILCVVIALPFITRSIGFRVNRNSMKPKLTTELDSNQ